ncbi:hypothetical protein RND71_026400 [Anisodus tanguticus]|uniref:Uncharacterized protein n=1 Tax=Anisodus tanguticus TaxID=243964 RepID=A0AAE1V8B0_9SOLA|nr:hypothetical protein RND71_026400 [Anisodus tanguticus]
MPSLKGCRIGWLTYINDIVLRHTLVRFDVGKTVFETLTTPIISWEDYDKQYLPNFEDSPSILMWKERYGCCIDVRVMDGLYDRRMKCKIGSLFGQNQRAQPLAEYKGWTCVLYFGKVSRKKQKKTDKGMLLIFLGNGENAVRWGGCGRSRQRKESTDYSESLLLVEGMLPVRKQDQLPRENLLRQQRKRKRYMAKNELICGKGIAKTSCRRSDNPLYWLPNISLVLPFELFLHSISDLLA